MRRVPVSSLTIDPSNARKHGEKNLAAIAASIKQFGQVEPLVVQKGTGRVIGGNGRLEVMRAAGETECDVIELEISDERATALGIALNRTGELAEWNDETLARLLQELPADLQSIAGFDEDDLSELITRLTPTEVDEDEVPPLLPDLVSRRGELWILGGHRLLCGDSTSAEDVGRVMNGERAALMNTDPPYGVGYANADRPNPGVAKPRVAKPRVAKDELCDDALQAFLESAFRAARTEALRDNAAWYLWHAHLTQGFFAAAAAAANVVLHRQIIWVKPFLLLTRGQYHWKHEPCFMGWVEGHQPPDFGRGDGERDQTTVWELDGVTQAERRDFNHSTPKPVGLFTIPLVKHTRVGEVCFEPFLGSGPQLVAAEQTGRRCFAIEIEPRYIDVAVRRWQKLTGKEATLESNGATWTETAAERGVAVA